MSNKRKKFTEIITNYDNTVGLYELIDFANENLTDTEKIDFISKFKLNSSDTLLVVKSLSDDFKFKIILENTYDFDRKTLINLISELDINHLLKLLNNKEFIEKYDIK